MREAEETGAVGKRSADLPRWVAGAALVVLTVVAYLPVIRAGFIWDDDDHVTENPTLRTVDGLRRIWTEPRSIPQYYPLTHTTFWVEYQAWEDWAAGYHATNVLIHGLSAVLLWRVLARLGVPTAWLVAGVFAVHPVHVESVAWISERKNVLSGFFYLAAGLAFLKGAGLDERHGHEHMPMPPRGWGRWYAASLVLFACALLSKTVAGSLPAALLLVIYWKRGSVSWRDVALTGPMFVAAIALGAATAYLERTHVGATGEEFDFLLLDRVLIAGRAAWFYAVKLLVPYPLIFFYPRWNIDPLNPGQYVFPVGAIALVMGLWMSRRGIGRGPVVAVLFFGGTLIPALGFVSVYPMRYSFVADHFQYLPSIGLLVLIVEGIRYGVERMGKAGIDAQTVVACALPVLGVLTFRQCFMYQDAETLWRTTIARNPTAWAAHARLAEILDDQGKVEEAVIHYATSVQLYPDYAVTRGNYGMVLYKLGRTNEALEQYREAVRMDPKYAMGHFNIGVVQANQRRYDEARQAFLRATEADPKFVAAWFNLGRVCELQERFENALGYYREAARLARDEPSIRESVARVEERLKRAIQEKG